MCVCIRIIAIDRWPPIQFSIYESCIATVPPTRVEIVDYPAGSRIASREGEEVVLQCLARNAKPAADIVWFKRNVEIKLGEFTIRILFLVERFVIICQVFDMTVHKNE